MKTLSMMGRLSIFFLVLITTATRAQLQFNSLQAIWKYADQKSPIALQGDVQRAISQEEKAINRSSLLPKLNLYGTGEYYPVIATQVIPAKIFGGPDGEYTKVKFGLPWSFATGLELNMPLINPEKWAQFEKFRLQTIRTDWNQRAQLENLHIQLAQWYYQALMARAIIGLNEQNIRITEELMRIMTERNERGILNPADFNRSRNLQLDVQSNGYTYQKLWQQSQIALRALMDIPDSQKLEITDSLSSFNWPLINQAPFDISQRPGWQEVVANTSVALQGLEESRKAPLPKLGFYGRYSYNWQLDPPQTVHFNMSTLGLRLDFPVFQGGYYRHQQKKSALLLQSAQLDQERQRTALVQQQQDWYNNYSIAASKQKSLQAKVQVTADNLRIANLSMQEGIMEFDEYNEIFREHNRAQIEYVQNLSDGVLFYLLLTQKIL